MIAAPHKPATAPFRALAAWVLVDWALQPFHTLILTFLFAPYFTTAVAESPARGQALWGYAAALAGVLIAAGSPLLGAAADRTGRRKPWVAASILVLAMAAATLWIARPAADAATITLVLAAVVIGIAASEFTTVFTNSLMPTLVGPRQLGRLSGMGWAVGYTGGLVSLAVMAGLLVADPATGSTLLGLTPIVELDTALRTGDRLVGPFAAVWLLIFMLPFFLLVPDVRGPLLPRSARSSLSELWATLQALPRRPNIALFLIARALYTDGLAAIFVFGGIYGTSVFGWQAFERGLFGIILTLAGIAGAAAGGILDDRLGAKRVIIGALTILIVGSIGILSVSHAHVLFTIPVAPKIAGSSPFSSTGEQVFLAFAIVIATVSAPNQSASRSLMARLSPPDRAAQYFGLFAFSGKVTAFAAPLLVALVTDWTANQRAGMAAILLFLIAGLIVLLPVREAGSTAGDPVRR
ncbi:MAG TPA: MFS transporter [Hyphomicrobiaceae bacterium]|nr:MFS transporter [Hyphomicrobiaceae bacterium]